MRKVVMKILALSINSPTATADQFGPHIRAEARRAWELHLAGNLREIYYEQGGYRAVLLLECASAAEAKSLLDSLPLVKAGLISFEMIPLVPYTGYAMLFADA